MVIKPVSFMQADGAREVGVEFHSLSKSYNMTGWRIGMVVGNAQMVDALKRVNQIWIREFHRLFNMRLSEAFTGPQDCIQEHNDIYQRRRDLLIKTLNSIGLEVKATEGKPVSLG